MVLLLRPEDDKVISVSRHKVQCHEEAYAKYDPSKGGSPLETFAVPKLDLEGEDKRRKPGSDIELQRAFQHSRSRLVGEVSVGF